MRPSDRLKSTKPCRGLANRVIGQITLRFCSSLTDFLAKIGKNFEKMEAVKQRMNDLKNEAQKALERAEKADESLKVFKCMTNLQRRIYLHGKISSHAIHLF